MSLRLENEPCATPAPLSLCGLEQNLEVSNAVGQSGDGQNELPRRSGGHGKFYPFGKLVNFGKILPWVNWQHLVNFTPLSTKSKGVLKVAQIPDKTITDFGGARRFQTCREPRRTSSCGSDDCGLVRWGIAFHP